jgi:endonuclease III
VDALSELGFLSTLARFYGPLSESGEPHDPFGLLVWENVAYLVDDARRRTAFDALRRGIGIEPKALLDAGPSAIEHVIDAGGMLPRRRAEKVLRCAQIAAGAADGDLYAALRELEPKRARALLKRFPGIGDPGADKIMLLTGLGDAPALDSNGVRVVERLRGVPPCSSYARSYRNAIESLRESGVRTARAAREAFERLRQHGRTLCRRANPKCPECPLCKSCAYGQKQRRSPAPKG